MGNNKVINKQGEKSQKQTYLKITNVIVFVLSVVFTFIIREYTYTS
jgi:hypothetical protein